jgi:alkylmercury lyase
LSFNSFEKTIEHISLRWRQTNKILLRQLFPLLAQGRPVSPTQLAQITGIDVRTVEQALIESHTDRDMQGNVIELFGISQAPTLHRIQIGHVCLFSCCALVSQMVPLLLSQTATIESVDPVGHRLIRLTVSPTGIQSVEPYSAVGTLVLTSAEQVLKDVRSAFCMHVHHFPDTDSAQEFVNIDPRRYMVSIQQLHDAARQLTAAIWS